MEDISAIGLKLGQARMSGEIAVLRNQQTLNHKQNRNDIHNLEETTKDLAHEVNMVQDSVNGIRIQLARLGGYAAGAGAAVAVIVKLIDHIWK